MSCTAVETFFFLSFFYCFACAEHLSVLLFVCFAGVQPVPVQSLDHLLRRPPFISIGVHWLDGASSLCALLPFCAYVRTRAFFFSISRLGVVLHLTYISCGWLRTWTRETSFAPPPPTPVYFCSMLEKCLYCACDIGV